MPLSSVQSSANSFKLPSLWQWSKRKKKHRISVSPTLKPIRGAGVQVMTIEVSVTSVLKGGTEPTGWSVKWIDSVEFSLLWWCQTENLTYSSPNSNRYVVSGSENPVIWEGSDRCLLSAAGLDRYSKHSQYFCSWGKKKYWTRIHESSLHPALTMWGILVLARYLKCSSTPSSFPFTHHLPLTRQNATSLSVIQLSQLG